jgi:acetyl-CoA carboxylase carboxyltransferase component
MSEKLSARERLELLFDPGTFVEIGAHVVHRCVDFGMEQKKPDGDGVITGYGLVDGREVFAYAQDFKVLGGSLGEMHARKIHRVQDLAGQSRRPLVGLNDSGGARIQEGVDSLGGYGEIFYRNVYWSGVIPQLSVIHGPCAGGAVYSPALTDFVAMVAKQSYMFLTGPKVVKAVVFEDVDTETLGGGRIHATKSGVAHFLYKTDLEAIGGTRKLLSYLPSSCDEQPPFEETDDDPERLCPDLDTVVPPDVKATFDTSQVIESVLDQGTFLEIHGRYARNLIVGFGRLGGHVVGIVANNSRYLAGVLDTDASRKGARFVRTCNAFNIPILTFVDVPGFMPGTKQEYGGIILQGAKMMFAYCEATVPKITVIMRKDFGGSYLVMNAKHIGGDVILAWPTAQVAVMGADGAVEIIFSKEMAASDAPAAVKERRVAEYNELFMSPRRAAERGFVDVVIEPSHTRRELVRHLEMIVSKESYRPPRRNGNIPM